MEHPIPTGLSQSHVAEAKLYADRTSSLACWPQKATVAELGVGFGGFTTQVLKASNPRLFDAYDIFTLHKIEMLWGKPSSETFKGKTHRQYYEDRFSSEISKHRLRVFEGDSSTLMAQQPEGFYDVIYIDGDHSLKGAEKDATASIPCLKPEGMLVFNDYVYNVKRGGVYGVVNVVNDLCVNQGWVVKYLALQREMFCDIALARG